jgi:thiol-disulfide isomerase/thioredoxin
MPSFDQPAVRAPDFLPGFTWLNVDRPLSLKQDLRGHVVLLDFWTYCCINCMHVLSDLARLERHFAGRPLVVIGVHSAKFLSEKDPQNIRKAIARYRVEHPVVVDSEHEIWQRYAVRAWPTLVLIDSSGKVRASVSGEPRFEALVQEVQKLLDQGAAEGTLASAPLQLGSRSEADRTFLRFPGKVLLDRKRLYVADSGHHRIVVADLDGRILRLIGEGGAGAHDGPASEASFQDPQGMAVLDLALYVADPGNHTIRKVDLENYTVSTVAGTGHKGSGASPIQINEPRSIDLRSPWALLAVGEGLLVAMAGAHQIWAFDPAGGSFGPWAGSGREDHIDGPLREAAFAQPSGLAQSGRFVLVADSEISSVRAVDLEQEEVLTLVGRGLFDFGDVDGAPDQVRLQHALDVTSDGRSVYVADSYNNKIKKISFDDLTTETLFGDGSSAILHEPGGLAVGDRRLYIADTNNHRLLVGELESGSLSELELTEKR